MFSIVYRFFSEIDPHDEPKMFVQKGKYFKGMNVFSRAAWVEFEGWQEILNVYPNKMVFYN